MKTETKLLLLASITMWLCVGIEVMYQRIFNIPNIGIIAQIFTTGMFLADILKLYFVKKK